MKTPELEPSTTKISNLESDKSAALLTQDELKNFRKLSKEEQKKQKEDRLKKLEELQNEFRKAVEEANKTGKVEEAKKLNANFKKEAEELKQLIKATEIFDAKAPFEVIPDKEITSAETAIQKLEKEGYKITKDAKDMLTKVNWNEPLEDSYKIISISVEELFDDEYKHTYAEIKAKAVKKSLKLVPAKLAPSICLNYENGNVWTHTAMEAVHCSDGQLKLFYSGGNDVVSPYSWLDIDNSGGDEVEWEGRRRFFFVQK